MANNVIRRPLTPWPHALERPLGTPAPATAGTVGLGAGRHPFRVDWARRFARARCRASYQTSSCSRPVPIDPLLEPE